MYKVLVADDEPLFCEGLGVLIEWKKLGFTIDKYCKNGAEVIKQLEAESYDLVLTDIRMPVIDGISLISIINSRWPNTKLIIISGFNEFEYAKKALEHGVKGFVVKPINRQELIKLLEKVRTELDQETGERKVIEKLWDIEWSSDTLLSILESGDLGALNTNIRSLAEELEKNDIHSKNREVLIYTIFSRLLTFSKKYNLDFDSIICNEKVDLLIRKGSSAAICNYLLSFCRDLAEHIASCNQNICPDVIADIKKYIELNLSEDLHINKIARTFYLNAIYLGRIFKIHTGETFNNYLNKRRIEKVKQLLLRSNKRISEIIEAVGFNNQEYFYRVFKRFEGISFAEYREHILASNTKRFLQV